jgi:flagellar basal-body rod modification protein FlgD
MQIDSTSSSSTADTSSTLSRVPQKTLGQNDFLKLITVQLANQDPMKPMEDTAFIAQMAQFTSLQQTTDLVSQIGLMRSSTNLTAASSLIGKTVTVETKADGAVSGKVDAVDTSGSEPLLVIGAKTYSLSSLKRVESTPTPATTGN